ncbi:MAG: YciI family protein [Actinomycetia bacterium]|nr:YciI family protein [Actinomycetes bacterium]
MAQYMYMIFGDESEMANVTKEDWALMLKAHNEFAEQVAKLGGTITNGDALAPTAVATTVRGQSTGSPSVTDGPFVETKEALGGFYVIDAKDLDEAIAFAKISPTNGGVEVRPVVDTVGG